MKLGLLTFNIILGGAILLRAIAVGEFDPSILMPASAELPPQDVEYIAGEAPANRINCEEMLHRVSVDAVRSVREPHRSMPDKALVEFNGGVYKINYVDYTPGKDRAGLESGSDGITNFALYHCDGEYIPSDTFHPGAGQIRMAYNTRSSDRDFVPA